MYNIELQFILPFRYWTTPLPINNKREKKNCCIKQVMGDLASLTPATKLYKS